MMNGRWIELIDKCNNDNNDNEYLTDPNTDGFSLLKVEMIRKTNKGMHE